jgi:nuclear-control-of-ATPase protein 2
MTSLTNYSSAISRLFSRSTRKTSKVLCAPLSLGHSCALPLFKFKRLKYAVRQHPQFLFTVYVFQVDVDQALAGIDKLLKSQELTFAFVGVAPALSLAYVVGGNVGRLYASSHGQLGGRRRRTAAWMAIRRIERLLITQPHTREHEPHTHTQPEHRDARDTKDTILPLTAGLLLLSVSSLRQFAEMWLPPRSRLREGFLEDVGDLEDPRLGREEKLRIVERMWRSWGHALGWERLAVEMSS